MRTKTTSVFLNSHKLPYDIFALSETNLSDDINSNELFPSDFTVFRDDGRKSDTSGRGVLLAIHNRFTSTLFKCSPSTNFEFICAKICLPLFNIYILCCYIRPSQPVQSYKLAIEAIDSLHNILNPRDVLIVVGDFNLPYLSWASSDDDTHFVPINPSQDKEVIFTDCLSDCGLFQLSGVKNNLNRQLDLVFSSDADNCVVSESIHLLSTLDRYHPPLSLSVRYDVSNVAPISAKIYSFNFRKANFKKIE